MEQLGEGDAVIGASRTDDPPPGATRQFGHVGQPELGVIGLAYG
jgi:hypothetical protein